MDAQLPDMIWIDGVQYLIDPKIPISARTGIVEVPEPVARYHFVYHEGCFLRGYMAEWLVSQGCLFLMRVSGRFQLAGSTPLLVDWFSGVLTVRSIPTCADVISEL